MSQYSGYFFSPQSKNDSWTHLYEYIPANCRVLDVGCAEGNFGASLIRLKNCEVIGIDPSDEDIQKARKNLTKAYKSTIEQALANRQLGTFDCVIFSDVLEHLVDPVDVLKRVKTRLLKPNGVICFSLPHMAHASVRLALLEGEFSYKNTGLLDKTHLHFYDRAEVNRIFTEAGLQLRALNPVVSEYPREMIEPRLEHLGLAASPAFYQQLEASGGHIFQLVGCAEPATKPNLAKAKDLNYVMPQDEIKAYADSLIGENRRLWEEGEAIKAQNRELQQSLEHIQARPWRFLARTLKHTIAKPRKADK